MTRERVTQAEHVVSERFNIPPRNALKSKRSVPRCDAVIVTVNWCGGTSRWSKSLSEERQVGQRMNKKEEGTGAFCYRGRGFNA